MIKAPPFNEGGAFLFVVFNFYGRRMRSTGFLLEIFIIGRADEMIAVSKLMSAMMKICLAPKSAK